MTTYGIGYAAATPRTVLSERGCAPAPIHEYGHLGKVRTAPDARTPALRVFRCESRHDDSSDVRDHQSEPK